MTSGFPLLSGVSALICRYDVFVLDLWGVLHDGVTAYDGALDALTRLKAAGKRTVLLSNAPRRADALVAAMAEMGLPRDAYDAIHSSGEATRQRLERRSGPAFASLGQRLYFIGQDKDRDVFAGLPVTETADPAKADFVLVCGPRDFAHPLAAYEAEIARLAATRPPMICANPDRGVIRAGRNVVCAGNIADLYAARGGAVAFVGKPDAAVYDEALALLGNPEKSRVAGIGDGLATDIPGCRAAGIDAVLCTGGVNAAALATAHGEMPDPAAAHALAAAAGETPVAAIPAFVWG
ncbi:TIGR01459 family HAD-type hydrolase [Oleispirillum naphthae]|uniref:TIGR01459 family HAD-type hydrolase n=1 Tax=Oleispirillum naphthae TaxID=2838853 RepID=UPI00308261A3